MQHEKQRDARDEEIARHAIREARVQRHQDQQQDCHDRARVALVLRTAFENQDQCLAYGLDDVVGAQEDEDVEGQQDCSLTFTRSNVGDPVEGGLEARPLSRSARHPRGYFRKRIPKQASDRLERVPKAAHHLTRVPALGYGCDEMPGWGLLLTCSLAATSSVADVDSSGVDWRWRKADAWDYSALGVAAAVTLGGLIAGPQGSVRRGGVLFDDSVRDAIRLDTEAARLTARDVSDVLLTIGWSYPVLIDAVAVAGAYHEDTETATELTILAAEVFGVTLAIQVAFNIAFHRERPYGENCGVQFSETTGQCIGNNRFYSFFSGHTAQTFASAGLTCQNHRYLDLYGPDDNVWITCAAGYTLAALTAYLRVTGDQHYTTDVLVGAFVGTATGLLIPWLTRYRHARPEASSVSLMLVPGPTGVSLVGAF